MVQIFVTCPLQNTAIAIVNTAILRLSLSTAVILSVSLSTMFFTVVTAYYVSHRCHCLLQYVSQRCHCLLCSPPLSLSTMFSPLSLSTMFLTVVTACHVAHHCPCLPCSYLPYFSPSSLSTIFLSVGPVHHFSNSCTCLPFFSPLSCLPHFSLSCTCLPCFFHMSLYTMFLRALFFLYVIYQASVGPVLHPPPLTPQFGGVKEAWLDVG